MINTLKDLYKCFKPYFFPNQIVFYNLFFNIPKENASLVNELENEIKKYLKTGCDYESFFYSKTSKIFYHHLLDIVYDGDYVYPSLKSISGENARRTYISTLMNKPINSAIPPKFKKMYFNKDGGKQEYSNIMKILLTYYTLIYHKSFIIIDEINYEISFNSKMSNTILDKLKKDNNIPDKDISTLKNFSNYLTECIWKLANPINKESKLFNEWDFYIKHVDCYGEQNINRYFALKEHDTNVYCAYKLGDLYYYGARFFVESENNQFDIPKDYYKAYNYYLKCIEEDAFIPAACWSIAYMVQKGLITTKNDRETYARSLFTKCRDYAPALNSLGLLDKEKADKIYLNQDYEILTSTEKELCCKYYLSFIDNCYRAYTNDWIYAGNVLYIFYTGDEYKLIRKELKGFDEYKELEPVKILQSTAKRKNPWAMDRLACHYISEYLWINGINIEHFSTHQDLFVEVYNGSISLKDVSIINKNNTLLKEALALLIEANDINYDRAAYHLAINFYYNTPIMSHLLEKAKQQGHVLAHNKLQELMGEYYGI